MVSLIPTKFVWHNGKLVDYANAKIHVLTHGLHYGMGVFEGIRCYETPKGPAVFRLREHVARLFESAKAYKMRISFSRDEILNAIKETVKSNELKSCYIRPIAFTGFGEMGLNPTTSKVDVAIGVWTWGAYMGEDGLQNGIKAKVSSWLRIDKRCLPTSAKACGNYLNSALAKMEALESGVQECILLNSEGNVAEATGENLFIVSKGKVLTPPVSAGILRGITRDSIIEIARDLGYEVEECNISRNELYNAGEVFLTGTAAEVTPVSQVDGIAIGNGKRGEVTKKLQDKFFEIVKGKDSKYEKWLEYVQALNFDSR